MPTSTRRLVRNAVDDGVLAHDERVIVSVHALELRPWRPSESVGVALAVVSVLAGLVISPWWSLGLAAAFVLLAERASPKRYLLVTASSLIVMKERLTGVACIAAGSHSPEMFEGDEASVLVIGDVRVKIWSSTKQLVRRRLGLDDADATVETVDAA